MDKPSARGRLKEARALIADSRHAEALELLQEPPPSDYMSLALCGLCAGELGDRRAAIGHYRSAAALDAAKMPAWQGAYKLLHNDVGQWRTLDADEADFMMRCVRALRDDTADAAKRSELGRHQLAGHLAAADYEAALTLCREADEVDMWRACLGVPAKGGIGLAHGRMLSEAYKSMRRVLDADVLMGELRFRYKYSADVTPVLECAAYVCDLDGLAAAGGAALASALLLQACVARRRFLPSPGAELFISKLHELQPARGYVAVVDALARRQSARAAQLLEQCGDDIGQDASPYRLYDLLQYAVAVHAMHWPDVLDKADAVQSIAAGCAWARGGHLLPLDRARAVYFIGGPNDIDKAEKLLTDVAACAESALLAFYLAVARNDLPVAEQRLERAAKQCGADESAVCAARAWLHLHSERLDDAVNAIQTHVCTGGAPDYWLHYVHGRCLYARGDYTAATLAAFLHCAKAEPCFAPAYRYLGKTYLMMEQSNVPKATRCLQRAHQLAPYAEETSRDLSDVYGVSAEHLDAHVELLRAAVARHAGATWAQKRLAYRLQAVGTSSAREESIGLLQRALSADDGDFAAWTCLADAYCERGSPQAAVACYAKASALRPADAYSAVRLGELSAGEGALALPARFPHYVPALLVAARAALASATGAFATGRYCRCAVELHAAMSHVVRALEVDRRLCVLWWHAMRCLCLAADVAHSGPLAAGGQLRAAFETLCGRLRALLGVCDDATAFDEASLYALAEKCCMASVRLAAADSLAPCLPPLWHDLAVVALQRGVHLKRVGDVEGARSSRRLCERCARAALRSCGRLGDSARFIQARCWLALGTAIVLLDERADARAAAHCFSAATHLDQSCARAWTALGLLYMRHGRHTAANRALSRAQAVEPEYGRCWAAQAMLAGGMDEHRHLAKDLFRHACELRDRRPSTTAQYARLVLADSSVTGVESALLTRHAAAVCARDAGNDRWRRLLAVARHLEGGGRTRHAALNAALTRLVFDGRPIDQEALAPAPTAHAPLVAALSGGRTARQADLDMPPHSPPTSAAECFLSPDNSAPLASAARCTSDADRLALLHGWLRARLVHGVTIGGKTVASAVHSFPYDSALRAVHYISDGKGDLGSQSFWAVLAHVEPELRALLLLEVCRKAGCNKIGKTIVATVRMLLPWVPLIN